MADLQKEVTVKRITWSEKVADLLSRIDTDVPLETARMQSLNGMKLLGVYVDGIMCGVFMLDIGADEIGVLWGAGQADGVDLTSAVLPKIEHLAKDMGKGAVFFLTKRQGLIRKAERIGYGYYETVMKKVI